MWRESNRSIRTKARRERREALDQVVAAHGRATNMKRTLARSPVALRSLMTWYDLRDEVVAFLGERATLLFAHAISSRDGLPDLLDVLSPAADRRRRRPGRPPAGRARSARRRIRPAARRDPHGVSDELFGRLAGDFNDDQIVALTAFGGLMVATNLFNNALRVDLDEYLWAYRKAEGRREGDRDERARTRSGGPCGTCGRRDRCGPRPGAGRRAGAAPAKVRTSLRSTSPSARVSRLRAGNECRSRVASSMLAARSGSSV